MEGNPRSKNYSVVAFPDEEEAISVIPNVWLKNNVTCYWPSCSDSQRWKFTEMQVSPEMNRKGLKPVEWKLCSIIIKRQTSTYQKAMMKMKVLVERSDASTGNTTDVSEARCTRKRKLVDYVVECGSDPKASARISNTNLKKSPRYPAIPFPPPLPAELSYPTTIYSDESSDLSSNLVGISVQQNNVLAPASSCGNSCIKQQKRDEKIFRLLEEIKQENKKNMCVLMEMLKGSGVPAFLDEDGKNLPIDTIPDLEALNEALLNKEYLKNMVVLLGVLGGFSIGDVTRRILQKLISPTLAMEINWSGRGKISIQGFKEVLLLIFLSVRSNTMAKDVTKVDIEKELKPWLRNARDRCGGRSQRARPRASCENNENDGENVLQNEDVL